MQGSVCAILEGCLTSIPGKNVGVFTRYKWSLTRCELVRVTHASVVLSPRPAHTCTPSASESASTDS
jgi:hypothetical protein